MIMFVLTSRYDLITSVAQEMLTACSLMLLLAHAARPQHSPWVANYQSVIKTR